jgi:thymidylate synthase ThyX
VSIVGTKILQDARIGGSPLEKSTRYVAFDQKRDGKYLYCREPAIMASQFAGEYESTMDLLFDTYGRLMAPLTKYVEEIWPLSEFEFQGPDKGVPPVRFDKLTDEKTIKRATGAYRTSVRAKVYDELRYLLPASTLTNTGIYGNGRFWQGLITRLYSDPLSEMQGLAATLHGELGTVIKPFVRRAKKDDYLASRRERMRPLVQRHAIEGKSAERVSLAGFEAEGTQKVVAACLFAFSHAPMHELLAKAAAMSEDEKRSVLDAYAGARRTRRDRPGRAFEQCYYDFEVCADYGAYRDIHRHRMLTQERQLLSCRHGFETPEELAKAGFEKDYSDAMKAASDLFGKLEATMPHEAQYCVPLGYKIRWRMRMNLREAYHLCELRSGMQGHASYRRIAIDMARHVRRVHPLLASHMTFVDEKDYPLGRLAAEMKKESKRAD